MGYSVGQANIDLTDSSGNSHTLTHQNNGMYATNNSIVPELNSTNFWTYNNGTANSTRWSSGAFTTAQPITIYALIRIQSFTSTRFFWDGGVGAAFNFRIASGPNATMSAGTDNTGGSITAGQWVWYEVHYNGASSFAKMNDATTLISTGNAGSGSLTQIELGDDSTHNFFNQMDVAYISYHNANMSSGFSTQFYAAAKDRFGTQLP
jgi:hypothetical protein